MSVYKKVSALGDSHSEVFFCLSKKYCFDIEKSFSKIFQLVVGFLDHLFEQLKDEFSLKIQLVYHIALEKYSFDLDKQILVDYWFPSSTHAIHSSEAVFSVVKKCNQESLNNYDSFVNEGSGWIMKQVLEVKLVTSKYHAFRGGCCKDDLPEKYRNSKALVSPQGVRPSQPDCFIRAIILGLTAKSKLKNKTRWSKKDNKLLQLISPDYFNFPVCLKQAVAFERASPFSVSIFGLVNKKSSQLFPYYVSEKQSVSNKFHIDLLFYKDHYYTILNLGALLRKGNFKNSRKLHVCPYCLSTFQTLNEFKIHSFLCLNKTQPLQFPRKDSEKFKQFKNFQCLLDAPFVIYADLESSIDSTEEPGKEGSKLKSKKLHQCIAWSTFTVCRPSKTFSSAKPVQYVGSNAIDTLFDHLSHEFYRIKTILSEVLVPIKMNSNEEVQFQEQETCEYCKIIFEKSTKKSRDHCHLTGKYRAALCNTCNLNFAKTCLNKVVIFFHGLSNYDSHFIIQELHGYASRKKLNIKVIPRTTEKYLSFSVGSLLFKDSYQFLGESLATLVNNLRNKDKEKFEITRSIFSDPEMDDIIYRKGVFPYNYLDSLQVLEETSLPPKDKFFNDLSQEHISQEDYEFAQKTWNTCEFKNLGQYLQFYLVLDVLLLADVFENFRSTCLEDYELDPVHYFSAAHYTMDAFLRKSEAKFQLLTDSNMYFFCLRAIRGGVSQVGCKRKVSANNRYMGKLFNSSLPSSFLIDLDANNLYGRCMMDFLPVGGFMWETVSNELLTQILNQDAEASKGFLLEVDLSCPVCVHDKHQDYPLAPSRVTRKYHDLSPFARMIVDKHHLKPSCGSEKLMTTLDDKKHYILHYRNLQLYLKLGLKLDKVHAVLSFDQAPVMRDYILFNSQKRAQATNPFDTALYKLLSNSLYGKTIERADNRTIVKLITDIESFEKNISKVTMKSSKIINPNLVALEMKHPVLKVDKPVYLGAVILELAKFYMYQFHYEVMKPKYGPALKLIYTDTDSLIYEIQTEDLYADFKTFPPGTLDFSNYPSDHSLFSTQYKRVPGCFKDETGGQIIESFVGLRSKMYSLKMFDSSLSEVKVAKGVKRPIIIKDLSFDDYKNCLDNLESMEHSFHSIRSEKHKVFTFFQTKSTLSPFDDKRWILPDGINSLPYGHYQLYDTVDSSDTEEEEEEEDV